MFDQRLPEQRTFAPIRMPKQPSDNDDTRHSALSQSHWSDARIYTEGKDLLT